MEPNFKEVERIIAAALAEDIGIGDITAELLIPEKATANLAFITRQEIVMCGGTIVPKVFAYLDSTIESTIHIPDGMTVPAGTKLITAQGFARTILTAERVALNLLQRMSSVATLTSHYVKAVRDTTATILDTRKTMPGLRELDKYAVRTGGGRNHRMRLDDGILIKDNHIALCGGITQALAHAQKGNKARLPLEIECDSLEQVQEAIAAGAKSILLDNMNIAALRQAVEWVAGRASLEASGNVTIDTVAKIASTGINFISVGRLTHSALNVDIGLDIALNY